MEIEGGNAESDATPDKGQDPKDGNAPESTKGVEVNAPEGGKQAKPEVGGDSNTNADSEDFDALPDWTKKLINKLRSENGKDRTKAKEQAAEQARREAAAEAEETRAKAVQEALAAHNAKLAKALGLVEETQEELTPEQLLEKVTAERDAERKEKEEQVRLFRKLSLENAVIDACNMHDGNADRILDSKSFLKRVQELDPATEGYRAAVADAVKQALEDDESFKVTKKPEPPKVSGGTTVAGSQPKDVNEMSIEDLIAAGFTKRR